MLAIKRRESPSLIGAFKLAPLLEVPVYQSHLQVQNDDAVTS